MNLRPKLFCLSLVTITILSSIASPAQVNVDSLQNVWNDETQADTSRLKAVDDLCFKHYMFVFADSALTYAQQMLDLATERDLKKYQANALHILGMAVGTQGDLGIALEHFKSSLEIREEINDKRGVGRSLSNIGSLLMEQGKNIEGYDHIRRANEIFLEIDDKDLIIHSFNQIGELHMRIGDYQNALKPLSLALDIAKETNNERFQVTTLMVLSKLHGQLNNPSNARDYALQAHDMALRMKHRQMESFSLELLGNFAKQEGKHEEMLNYYQKCLIVSQEAGLPIRVMSVNASMGEYYRDRGEHEKALKIHQEALSQIESLEMNFYKGAISINVGRDHLLLGDPEEAIRWCKKGLSLAEETNDLESQMFACQYLYEAFKSIKDGNNALTFHERFLVLNDSLQKDEAGKKLQQMEFAKQVLKDSIATAEEKRIVEIAHREEVLEKNKTRNALIGAGFILLLLALGFYSRWKYVRRSRDIISKEKDRSENLLLNILPAEIAEELKEKGEAQARDFEMVSILFTDFKGFTEASAKLSAANLVEEINTCFRSFDAICEKYKVEKIKTIGDAYMAAGGLPVPTDDSTKNTVLAALEMQTFISKRKAEMDAQNKPAFEMRVGIHTGPVVAGIVGVKKFQYDIWGDTVNTAARIESHGEVGKVNISQYTYELIKDEPELTFENRGKIEAKGKGLLDMYYVDLRPSS